MNVQTERDDDDGAKAVAMPVVLHLLVSGDSLCTHYIYFILTFVMVSDRKILTKATTTDIPIVSIKAYFYSTVWSTMVEDKSTKRPTQHQLLSSD